MRIFLLSFGVLYAFLQPDVEAYTYAEVSRNISRETRRDPEVAAGESRYRIVLIDLGASTRAILEN